jgi:hypothetical protein
MSNHLSIATVTATLQKILQSAVQEDVVGSRVTTVRPQNLGEGTPETGVNLFLYQVSTNAALNNVDSTQFYSKGSVAKRQAALDLYYMLSFYGNETELEPQRMLGSVVRALNDQWLLSAETIRQTVANSSFTFLRDSNLAEQIPQVLVIPITLSLEEISQLWSSFFQTPYVLSLAYKVSVVIIEGQETAKRSLPIRTRQYAAIPNQPVVEEVISQAGRFIPIATDSILLIRGKQLQAEEVQVRICGVMATPQEVSQTQIKLELSSIPTNRLQAGVQGLQVIHPANRRTVPRPNGIESNVAAFVLRPTVMEVSVSNVEEFTSNQYSANVVVRVDVTIGSTQRVVLFLNQISFAQPDAYIFEAKFREHDTDSITIPIRRVKTGEYLVRVQVDGAESLLRVDTDSNSPTFEQYIGPKIAIP